MREEYKFKYAQVANQFLVSVKTPDDETYGFASCLDNGFFMLSNDQMPYLEETMSKGKIEDLPVKDNDLVKILIENAKKIGACNPSKLIDYNLKKIFLNKRLITDSF